MSEFRSLFLPLAEAERAVFAGVFPLLFTLPASIEGGAAAAAGEHSGRPTAQSRHTTHVDSSTIIATTTAAGAAAASATPARFTPAEGAPSPSSRESVSEAQARRGIPLRSLVFAVGCARADAVLVVLRTAHVVVLGLDRHNAPPYELYRLHPLPTTQQLQVAREAAVHKAHHGSGGSAVVVAAAEATCASLVPLHIAYCCRLIVPRESRTRGAPTSGRHSATGDHRPGGEEQLEEEEVYLRGIVGSSDGRVSVFSDVAYTLSFAAHETPVAQVDAVLLPPSSLYTSGAYTGGVSRPGSPTVSGSPLLPFPAPPPPPQQQQRQQHRSDAVQQAMERLGILTSGTDGVILLWRRLDGAMAPVVLLRPSAFARQVPYTPYHPNPLSALLSSFAPKSHREAAIDAALCCPPSCLVHATSRHAHGLRVRQLASLASAAPIGAPSQTTATAASAGRSHELSLSSSAASSSPSFSPSTPVEAGERAAPTWLRLPMPGSWTAAVTALTVHNGLTLIARETTLFSLVRFDGKTPTRVWRAESAITQLVLQDTVALAVCGRAGAVHVLSVNPVTGQGVHQRSFYSYQGRPIQHVSLHASSLLMTVVDVVGSTELVELPRDVLHFRGGGRSLGTMECTNLLASMAALRAKVCIEEVKGSGATSADASCGVPSMYAANAALDELNEQLLLARCAVPEACDRYLAVRQHVF